MKFKLRVKDLGGNWHVHRFVTGEAAYRHWFLYILDGSVTDMQCGSCSEISLQRAKSVRKYGIYPTGL